MPANDLLEPPHYAEDERRRIIAETIERLRPKFVADGGDIALVSCEGLRVRVRLSGACSGCDLANATLGWVRRRLSDALGGGPISVIPALEQESLSS